jgi:curved DNA-binding protein
LQYHDYYSTLDVEKNSSPNEIQRAYRKLARQYHPDINKEEGAENRFKDIGEAYEVLKDPEKRAQYDRYGKAWKATQKGGAPPQGWDGFQFDFGSGGGGFEFSGARGNSGFSSFFDMLFSGAGRGGGAGTWGAGAAGPQRGTDQESNLSIRLEEIATGGRRQLTLTDPRTGEQRTLQVKIPQGVRNGQKIRLAGQGAPGANGGEAGDLLLKISLEAHPAFRVDGANLLSYLEVDPATAALGGEAKVLTLDGTATVRLPPGSSSGRKIRLRDRGLPTTGGDTGDLLAEVRIVVPRDLSEEERALYERLADLKESE